ncbi:MAG: two-component sensor histidine kinase [Candidatus Jettenia sp.]|uniref:histidine kinase n=1 Tax=Candidatus Jettenia caeni TaxID=247490 RepID=I3IPM8_9BACT|nr:ATP-binding protein [Candidatus Jettenia sp. AMX1]MBC6930407.1 two-component sensor histidine kinase [Candidatus Jettenia sp.]WKZ16120.1 MAG: ATP-binding protein [Candidatus Jettenia caeni]KAA0247371.1 MAG: two-component sensor histidine kinase [Candidatus Jettenia sp. AMX1]MCE7882091.1 two-component sensor histidine kinase [Candidatus Jettenia sp. AMX1]MCQ3928717.1 two-component sensor histidine kinase [Candidatus Jettenia sp.]
MPKFQKILHPEKFNLILYYTITSFVVITLLSLAVGWIFPRMESQELMKRSEEYARYFITHLNYEIYKDFLHPTLKLDKYVDLEKNHKQFRKLDKIVRENLYGLNIKKLYLYDLEGHIIYSTVPEHIGFTLDQGNNKNLDSAIHGIHASALRLAGATDSKGSHVVETLLESYYPFYELEENGYKKGRQVGVLEIYQDMSGLKKQMIKARKKAIIMTSSAMGVLFLILFLIVLKAARIIHARAKQLIDARNTLEQKVEERTFEIREAYKKLQDTQRKLIQSEKLASIGTLVTGLAHEINNPLASVASCAEGLIERFIAIPNRNRQNLSGDFEVFPEYLKIICDETYRCKSIISNLLNFSRHSEPKFEKINVHRIIHEALSIVQHQPQSKCQKIQLHLSEEPCNIIGDPQQLKQVFLNLLINSLHATEESGSIFISTCRKQTFIQITFKDSGMGIKREHLDKIFDPFFTTKPTGKGTGLGLAICYGIIDVHNGRIEVFSEGPGKGATFTIVLPLAIEVEINS